MIPVPAAAARNSRNAAGRIHDFREREAELTGVSRVSREAAAAAVISVSVGRPLLSPLPPVQPRRSGYDFRKRIKRDT